MVPGTRLYAIGDPSPLVLTGRRNPDRFIYLESGVAKWKIDHTRGGFRGWVRQIRSSRASVVVLDGWDGARVPLMARALVRHGFSPGISRAVGPSS